MKQFVFFTSKAVYNIQINTSNNIFQNKRKYSKMNFGMELYLLTARDAWTQASWITSHLPLVSRQPINWQAVQVFTTCLYVFAKAGCLQSSEANYQLISYLPCFSTHPDHWWASMASGRFLTIGIIINVLYI